MKYLAVLRRVWVRGRYEISTQLCLEQFWLGLGIKYLAVLRAFWVRVRYDISSFAKTRAVLVS